MSFSLITDTVCLTKVYTIILELSLISHLIQVAVYEAGFLRAELSADSDDFEDIC